MQPLLEFTQKLTELSTQLSEEFTKAVHAEMAAAMEAMTAMRTIREPSGGEIERIHARRHRAFAALQTLAREIGGSGGVS